MTDLFGQTPRQIRNIDAYAATPGTGPAGKKCKDCLYCIRKALGEKAVHKCIVGASTNSSTTDINSRSPACGQFSAKDAK